MRKRASVSHTYRIHSNGHLNAPECMTNFMRFENRRTIAVKRVAGFTMIELVMVMLVAMVISAFALPIVSDVVNFLRLRSAVANTTWAIQSVRFQALMAGYPFQVTFAGGTGGISPSYQIASMPSGTLVYSNVGGAIPLSGSPAVLTAATVATLLPNGVVTMTTGGVTSTTMQISYAGNSNTITVSNYGNISVTSP
jgi:Tfp pilus assembly protein FimT